MTSVGVEDAQTATRTRGGWRVCRLRPNARASARGEPRPSGPPSRSARRR